MCQALSGATGDHCCYFQSLLLAAIDVGSGSERGRDGCPRCWSGHSGGRSADVGGEVGAVVWGMRLRLQGDSRGEAKETESNTGIWALGLQSTEG